VQKLFFLVMSDFHETILYGFDLLLGHLPLSQIVEQS